MMDAIRQYALTLICTALVCAILMQMVPAGTGGMLLRLACSAVMLSALLAPLWGMTLPDPEELLGRLSLSGEQMVQAGTDMAEEERLMLIKQGLEAYILDRASGLGCAITADIELDRDGYPVSVRLTGAVPEGLRKELGNMISDDLGIPEEDQQWTVENQKN